VGGRGDFKYSHKQFIVVAPQPLHGFDASGKPANMVSSDSKLRQRQRYLSGTLQISIAPGLQVSKTS
jgi:hypothetical protein